MSNVDSLAFFVPELILTVSVMLVLLADIVGWEQDGLDVPGQIALTGSIFAFLSHVYLYELEATSLFSGMLVHDPLAVFFRGFFLLSTVVVVAMTLFSREFEAFKKSETYAILFSATIGMCLVAGSQDLLMVYLAVELMSMGSYILAGFARNQPRSQEAALKYILYGSVSTGVMLFGLTWLYGLSGSTSFEAVQSALSGIDGGVPLASYLIFIFVMAGVGYKIAMVPFHFWAPDVYEGSPTPVTAFLSVASKAAGFALLVRFFYSTLFSGFGASWQPVGDLDLDWPLHLAILSAITMTVGNIGAYPQTNLKRLMAYSGIAHAGYLLMGVAILTRSGLESILFYLVMYFFTNFAAFLVIIMVIESAGDERFSGIRGLWKRAPLAAVVMSLALFSLVGLPPTAGFIGKYYLFYAVLDSQFYWLAIVGVINTVLSLYYYARILKAMYLETGGSDVIMRVHPMYSLLLVLLGAPVLILGIYWNPVVEYVQYCAQMMG